MNQQSRTPLLHELYHRYLVDQNSEVFRAGVTRRYTIGTLERLSSAGDRMARRAAILALGVLADYSSNAAIGRALQDTDRGVRILADNAIRQVWSRVGTPRQRKGLAVAMEFNGSRRFQEAIDETTRLIAEAPSLAEAWNQRALALFSLGRFAESICDCIQTLELNPYHFGAATGMAQSYLQTSNRTKALESFRRALSLNPSLEGVRAHVLYLQRTLKSQE